MEGTGGNSTSRRYGMFSASSFIQAPLSSLLEYSGLLRGNRSGQQEASESSLIGGRSAAAFREQHRVEAEQGGNDGEVSIRIIGPGEEENDRESGSVQDSASGQQRIAGVGSGGLVSEEGRTGGSSGEGISQSANGGGDEGEAGDNGRDSTYQRYNIQQVARWIEQGLPFALLLLVVFIRQHLQGFCITIGIGTVLLKSNEILKKQTALKGERNIFVLASFAIGFLGHVIGIYWLYEDRDLLYPLVMLPPKAIPPFWHAIFMIMVNDILARQATMSFKCILLIYYKNSRGRNYRKQGQMLTLVEYLLLFYRALLPTPVWYRFFLNKEYGSLFSSLMTGLYLTFKLTTVVEKVQSFFAAIRALSRKDVNYGAYATTEQVVAAGDLCAICQEKMHAPILLRCKHIFCEDCVSEWFERERTCPLCRSVVKSADLKSFGDGSTSLSFQLF